MINVSVYSIQTNIFSRNISNIEYKYLGRSVEERWRLNYQINKSERVTQMLSDHFYHAGIHGKSAPVLHCDLVTLTRLEPADSKEYFNLLMFCSDQSLDRQPFYFTFTAFILTFEHKWPHTNQGRAKNPQSFEYHFWILSYPWSIHRAKSIFDFKNAT